MKLFRKLKSKYYWYDFTVRGCRYRGSTEETKAVRAADVASLKLAHAVEGRIHLQASVRPWLNLLSDSWPGYKMPDWKTKPRPITVTAGDC